MADWDGSIMIIVVIYGAATDQPVASGRGGTF